MATSITTRISSLSDKFVGISTLRWRSNPAALSASTAWDFELPVLRDSVDFSFAQPSLTNSKIYGSQTPWTTSAEPGEIELALTIPSISDALLSWGFTKHLTNPTSFEETAQTSPSGVAGSWSFKGYDLTMKAITGSMMIVSDDAKYCLIVKNFKGFASIIMDDLTNTPMGIRLSGTITTPVSGDTDGDVVFGTFTASQL